MAGAALNYLTEVAREVAGRLRARGVRSEVDYRTVVLQELADMMQAEQERR